MGKPLHIKICGMRDPSNMAAIAELGIDYMGFIFYARSPRYLEHVPGVQIPESIRRTGVFVNATEEAILEKCASEDLDVVQLHGHEQPETCHRLRESGLEVIKALAIGESADFRKTVAYAGVVDAFLFDTKTSRHGGSGKRFDWTLLHVYSGEIPFFLSGGIRPGMAAEIRRIEHPDLIGVDLNSGFEDAPGLKSVSRLKTFIHEFRS